MKFKAWIRPLKPDKHGSRWQYHFSARPDTWASGSAYSREAAHDAICDAAYGAGYLDGWEIEEKRPFGKWAA